MAVTTHRLIALAPGQMLNSSSTLYIGIRLLWQKYSLADNINFTRNSSQCTFRELNGHCLEKALVQERSNLRGMHYCRLHANCKDGNACLTQVPDLVDWTNVGR